MKKTIWMFAAIMLTLATYAQKPNRPMNCKGNKPNMGQKGGGPHQFKDLDLTESQQKQLKTINTDFQTKMKALRENEQITVKEQRDRMDKLTTEHRQQIKQLLTPEQQQKMNAQREKNSQSMQEMQAKHFEKMATELKLNDTQKASLKLLHEKNRAEMMSLRDNESLDRTAKQEQMKKIMDQHRKELAKVLTKEQMNQWEQMKNDKQFYGPGGPGKQGGPGGKHHKGMRGPGVV